MTNPTQTTPKRIIPDEEIDRVHANANFGSMTNRQVVNEGLLKYAVGYSSGETQRQILIEHGLIRKTMGIHSSLTAKGHCYLASMLREANFEKLKEILDV